MTCVWEQVEDYFFVKIAHSHRYDRQVTSGSDLEVWIDRFFLQLLSLQELVARALSYRSCIRTIDMYARLLLLFSRHTTMQPRHSSGFRTWKRGVDPLERRILSAPEGY